MKELKKIEQNFTWSEEDEKAINDIMWIIEAYRKNGFNETHIQMADSSEIWLKSLKNKVQLHPKQEWSEKDKCMLNNVIDTLRALSETTHSGYAINSMIAWLKKHCNIDKVSYYIVEKAEDYDKALEKAKILLKTIGNATLGNLVLKNEFENMFPELSESDDERIRKAIIDDIQCMHREYSLFKDFSKEAILAWLEKQCEQPQGKSALEAAQEEKVDNQNYVKPTDKVEPKFKVGDKIYLKPEYRMPDDDTPIANTVFEIRAIDDKHYKFDGSYIFIEDQDKYELVEQRPAAWSEEDERMYRGLHNLIYSTPYCDSRKELSDWLESLKERVCCEVNCTTTKGWSEEDRKIIIELIGIFESAVDGGNITFPYRLLKDYIRVLKSCMPQTNWRPSKEQIMALRWILNNIPYCKYKEEISGLLDQIKDL